MRDTTNSCSTLAAAGTIHSMTPRSLSLAVVLITLSVAMARDPVAPSAASPARPRIYANVEYASAGLQSMRMDLYVPAGAKSPVPVVVYIHGGDWMYGDRRQPPVLFLLDKGIAVASIDYRLAPRFRFPTQIRDCRDAVAFLRTNARNYRIDPARIGVCGESAGGHLAALLGTAPEEKQFIGTRGAKVDCRVQAVCSISGPMDIEYLGGMGDMVQDVIGEHPIHQLLGGTVDAKRDLARLASPIRHVTPDAPPFLLVIGQKDWVVLPILGQRMHKALLDAGVSSQLHEIPDMGHDMQAIWTDQTRTRVADFFVDNLINPRPTTRPATRAASGPLSPPAQSGGTMHMP